MTLFWILLTVGLGLLVWKPRATIAASMFITSVMLLVVVFVPGATSSNAIGLLFTVSAVHTMVSLVVLAIMALTQKPL